MDHYDRNPDDAVDTLELEPLSSIQHSRPPRPRQKKSIWRCAAYTFIIIVILLVSALTYISYTVFYEMSGRHLDPHSSLVYNGTIHSNLGASVVRPLVDLETTYDLAGAVFVRKPRDETTSQDAENIARHKAKLAELGKWTDLELNDLSRAEEATAELLKVDVEEVRTWAGEELLWSGYLGRGLSLKDKQFDTNVTFELPLERFYDRGLMYRDLRLGIAIIPRSPSLIDRLEDFTHWKGDVAEQTPAAIDDNILQAISFDHTAEKDDTTRIQLVESLVTGYSLLEFQSVPDHCEGRSETDSTMDEDEDLYSSIMINDMNSSIPNVVDEKGKHPFVTLRSHFYIVNETRLFQRKAYDDKHKILLETSCGRNRPGIAPSWLLCRRGYLSNGNLETRLVLNPTDPKGKKELAYGPYISRLRHSAGPKDVTKLPVSRGTCNGVMQNRTNDPTSITVTHQIRFSTLSPSRMGVLDTFGRTVRSAHNASEGEIVIEHDTWMHTMSLWGDRHEGHHPKRRLAVNIMSGMLYIPKVVLTVLYWYTRSTPTGISHAAAYLLGIGRSADVIVDVAWLISTEGYTMGFVYAIFSAWSLAVGVFIFRLVWNWEWSGTKWTDGWRRTQWSRRERKSMRIEAQVPARYTVILVSACWAVIYIPTRLNIYLVSPLVTLPYEPAKARWYASPLSESVWVALQVTGSILQLDLNRRSRTFAGHYALTAYIRLAERCLNGLWYVRRYIGRYDAEPGLRMSSLLWFFIDIGFAWQAWTLPRVEQDIKEVEEE